MLSQSPVDTVAIKSGLQVGSNPFTNQRSYATLDGHFSKNAKTVHPFATGNPNGAKALTINFQWFQYVKVLVTVSPLQIVDACQDTPMDYIELPSGKLT